MRNLPGRIPELVYALRVCPKGARAFSLMRRRGHETDFGNHATEIQAFLDAYSLAAIPEPASLALSLILLGTLLLSFPKTPLKYTRKIQDSISS